MLIQDENGFYEWIKEKKVTASAEWAILLRDLYYAYKSFCLLRYCPLNKKNFKKELIKNNFLIKRTNVGFVVFLDFGPNDGNYEIVIQDK